MPVEIMLGYRLIPSDTPEKKPRTEPLTAKQMLEAAELQAQTDGTTSLLPPEEPDPLQHHFLHELECLWWLTLWSITCKIGKWNYVKNVFVPLMTDNVAIVRKAFLTDPVSFDFAALSGEMDHSLQHPYLHLRITRDYFRTRFFELSLLSTAKREDPGEYSVAYRAFRDLVRVNIPSDAPPVVQGSNPFWKVVSEGGLKAPQPEAPSKRPRSDS